jgi:hypothetical protein
VAITFDEEDRFEHTKDFYRIILTKEEWGIEDLYDFPHVFNQCYSFIYCLDTERPPEEQQLIDYAFQNYPWRGGYSYVNIYAVMANAVPWRYRPTIKSIAKSSPGHLDLYLIKEVAQAIAICVGTLSGVSITAAKTYTTVKKILAQIEANKKFARAQQIAAEAETVKQLTVLSSQMAKYLGFKSLAALHERTGDPVVTMKLIAAHYRRLKQLADFVEEGKAVLPVIPIEDRSQNDDEVGV